MQAAGQRQTDRIQSQIATFALGFDVGRLSASDVDAAKTRVIDTLGAALGGFDSETCRITRQLGAQYRSESGALMLGTDIRVTAEMAAFVNATASREAEMNDVYMSLAGAGAHPSDVLLPIMAVGEQLGTSGADFLAAVVVAYEIYMDMSDRARIAGFDQTALAGIAVAAAAGRLLGLTPAQMEHSVSIAVIANNPLNQSRRNELSMWKAAASGQAGKAGVFGAFLAKAGMEGPHLPFEGDLGWLKLVCQSPFSLDSLGQGPAFRIAQSQLKPRSSCQVTISSILAAEAAAAQLADIGSVERVLVETYAFAHRSVGSGEHRWRPTNRESADHSIPYVVAAALADGKVGPRQFELDRINDPAIRDLMMKVEVTSLDAFTVLHEQPSPQHHTRVTAFLANGQRLVGEAGGDKGDIANPMTRQQVEQKFLQVVEDRLGAAPSRRALDTVWSLDQVPDIGQVAPLLVLES